MTTDSKGETSVKALEPTCGCWPPPSMVLGRHHEECPFHEPDQALSAPTAESAQVAVDEFVAERKEQLSRAYDSPLTQAANGYAPSEPAPVAEAPERCRYCKRAGCESHKYRDSAKMLRECRHAVQLERDFLVNRCKRLESYENQCHELRAKLSESERKMGSFALAIRGTCEAARQYAGWKDARNLTTLLQCVASSEVLLGEAAKEPTGGEPAKPYPPAPPPCAKCGAIDGQCDVRGCLTAVEQAEPVSPPAAEAEPRFRVGQRGPWTPKEGDRVRNDLAPTDLGTVQKEDPVLAQFGVPVVWDSSPYHLFYVSIAQLVRVEPADPAPPRPVEKTRDWNKPLRIENTYFINGHKMGAGSNTTTYGGLYDWMQELEREGTEKP